MVIRPQVMATARFGFALAGDLATSAFTRKSIDEVCADALIRAPNRGRRSQRTVAGEIRVAVGPPSAEISIAVVSSPAPRGTVFVLHGIRDSKASMHGWAAMLAAAGHRAILVDLRGHGRSTGSALTYGVQESLDLVQVLDTLTARGVVQGPVGIMGNSYGAAVAIQWAGRDPRIKAAVVVASFASLRAVVPSYAPWPRPLPLPFVNRVIDLAGVRGGFDPDHASPVDAITRTKAPILLIHGRHDARIASWHAERIHAAGANHTELVLIDHAGHRSVTSATETRLADRTQEWFARDLVGR